jgi:FkbM family methyltransferase
MYVFVPYVDGYGSDSSYFSRSSNLLEQFRQAEAHGCVAFNTLGYFKTKIDRVDVCMWYHNADKDGLWVLRSEYEANPAFNIIKKLLAIHEGITVRHGKLSLEINEQYMAAMAIAAEDVVLELGGNIGRNSLVISAMLSNDKNLVVFESNPQHAAELLENRELNRRDFHVESAALSKRRLIQNHWNTKTWDGGEIPQNWAEVATITWQQVQDKYKLKFNVLVADCEGALVGILKDEPELLRDFNKLVIKNDCTPEEKVGLRDVFLANGFVCTYSADLLRNPVLKGFWEIWIRSE